MIENHKSAMVFHEYPALRRAFDHRVCLPDKIGVMADSHGNIASIEDGIKLLAARHVEKIVHLGDVFDSEIHDRLTAVMEIINRHDILTVKGNNDFQIEKMLENGNSINIKTSDRYRIRQFIALMKLYVTSGGFCFAHSLPYDSIRSFYEPIDNGSTDQAAHVFRLTDHHVLFSGHSHAPVLFRRRSGSITREPIITGNPLYFKPGERYIIIVGSTDRGECGFIDRGKMVYERIRW